MLILKSSHFLLSVTALWLFHFPPLFIYLPIVSTSQCTSLQLLGVIQSVEAKWETAFAFNIHITVEKADAIGIFLLFSWSPSKLANWQPPGWSYQSLRLLDILSTSHNLTVIFFFFFFQLGHKDFMYEKRILLILREETDRSKNPSFNH